MCSANHVNSDLKLSSDEEDDAGKDPTYVADETETSGSDGCETSNEDVSINGNGVTGNKSAQSGKKKLRRSDSWSRNKAKRARNEGQKYTDRKGNLYLAKKLQEDKHICRFKCNENINEEKRQKIFEEFWNLGDWNLQSSFLFSAICIDTPVRKKGGDQGRTISCQYNLCGHRVCKSFFLSTLDVSNKRVTNIVKKKSDSASGCISPKDKRGHKEPSNKMPEETINHIKEHINSFPKYSSHYSRHKNPDRKYLAPHLNIKLMYGLYTTFCTEKNIDPVKESYYRHIFNTHFNLSFHRPHTETCVTCDKLQNIIDHGEPPEIATAKCNKELHLRKAEAARTAKQDAIKDAKQNADVIAICFDLQKTLPTPLLTCSSAYYARQLWTYNFCIHNLVTGDAKMFMWHEAEASRGCQEIASCLLKFINNLPQSVKHIKAFSDNAGGQNKSHLIVKFWLYVIRNTQIQTVDHKFLVSGHSFMECDQNFGIIEKAKKKNNASIFVPEHWSAVVSKSSRKFMVVRMKPEDFITLEVLKPFLKNSVQGIRRMQWLHFQKDSPLTLFYKETVNEDMEFLTINMKVPRSGKVVSSFPTLIQNSETPKLKYSKFRDLQQLLPYVPPIHHDFYNKLPHREKPGSTKRLNEDTEDYDSVFDSDSD